MKPASALPVPLAKRLVALLVVGALALAGFAVGAEPAMAANTASISGTVVTVEAPQTGASAVRVELYTETGDYVNSTATTSAGAYSFTGLAAGRYKVSYDDSVHFKTWSGSKDSLGSATVVVVAAGQAVTANAILEVGGVITGTAIVPVGTVLGSGVTVVVVNAKGRDVTSTVAAASGKYTIGGLTPGSYTLRFSYWVPSEDYRDYTQWWGNTTSFEAAPRITITGTETKSNPAITLTPQNTASISGTVTGGGLPVAGRTVYATSGYNGYSATTDANGVYTIKNLPAGTFAVRAGQQWGSAYASVWFGGSGLESTATPITVAKGQTATGKNLVLPEGGTISGTLLGAGSPAGPITSPSYARANIYDADGRSPIANGSAFSISTGEWSYTGLPPGNYRIQFEDTTSLFASQWWSGARSLATATPVVVGSSSTTSGLNATLQKSASISGTLTFPAGTEVGAFVQSFDSAGDYGRDSQAMQTGPTTATYTLRDLTAGSYRVGIWPHDRQLLPHYFGGASLDTATPIAVTTGQDVVGKNLTLARGASISGTVKNVAGENLDGAVVPVWQKVGSDYVEYSSVTTNGVGAYTVPQLPAGTYKVAFSDYASAVSEPTDTGYKYTKKFFDNATTLAAATPIAVTTGQAVTGKNAVLEQAAGYLTLTAPQPTITGSVAVGGTLTRATGTWGPVTVATATQWKRNGVSIAGATGATYVVAAADAGAVITVAVTGTKSTYNTRTKTSLPTAAVTRPLTASPAPTISGTAVRGRALTATPGTWTPTPVALAFQWKRAGVAISGATASTYTLAAADVGKAITVTVTGTKSGYTAISKTSTATAAVLDALTATPVPTITGTAVRGKVLTVAPGVWSPATVTLKIQWRRAGVAISGATASTYTLVAADLGKAITVSVTGSKTGFVSTAKTSAATAAVVEALTATPVPTITGTTTRGKVLTAASGTWKPAPVVLKYQWRRAGVAIAGATAGSYTLAAADVGKAITVTVTGTKTGYAAVSKTSVATAVVLDTLTATPVPTITGTKTVASVLTAKPGTWTPAPVTLKYQWLRAGVAIPGATAATYKVVAADKSVAITVRVTGSKAGFVSVAKVSAAK